MEFEPVEALLANWQTIGGQEQRTNRVVTLKIEGPSYSAVAMSCANRTDCS